MTPEELRRRTKRFAVDVIRFRRQLPRTDEGRVIGRQLLRAGTAVGANYRSVCRGRSDAEFVAKLGVVIEEADETAYWLEILVEAEIVPQRAVGNLLREADELVRIFAASRQTVRARLRTQKQKNTKSE